MTKVKVEYYSGHRGASYPVRILRDGIWHDVQLIESAIIEDASGKRKRRFCCRVGDEIIDIEREE